MICYVLTQFLSPGLKWGEVLQFSVLTSLLFLRSAELFHLSSAEDLPTVLMLEEGPQVDKNK